MDSVNSVAKTCSAIRHYVDCLNTYLISVFLYCVSTTATSPNEFHFNLAKRQTNL